MSMTDVVMITSKIDQLSAKIDASKADTQRRFDETDRLLKQVLEMLRPMASELAAQQKQRQEKAYFG